MSPKWALAIGGVCLFFYFMTPVIFRAMKKHDYDSLYNGIQDAKRAGGSFVQEPEKPYKSYAARYAKGEI